MLRPNSYHVSMGRRVLRGCQGPSSCRVPSLTPCDTLYPDGCRVLMSCQVPSGCLVPFLTLQKTHSALTVVTYLWVVRYQGVVRDLAIIRYHPWQCTTCSALTVVTYQWVIGFPVILRYFLDTTWHASP